MIPPYRNPDRKNWAMAENVAAPSTTTQESEDVDVCTVEPTQMKPIVPMPTAKYAKNKPSPSGYSRKRSLDASEDDDCDADPVSRKEKSLGKLCQKFLQVMHEEETRGHDIHLETVAKSMNVEKRRIYDIVNVMEALDAMAKTNKSYYKWHGLRRLPQLMASLQRQAVEEGLPERVAHVEQAMCNFTEIKRRSSGAAGDVVGSLIAVEDKETPVPESPQSSQSSSMSVENLSQSVKGRVNRDRYGQNSLANLCRRFLMVLLCNPDSGRKVSLDVASTVLIKDPETEGFEPPSRSRCRRLYDIANVLVAMNLIKKVHYLFGTKKIPLFVYCGPNPDESEVNWKAEINKDESGSPPPTKMGRLEELAEVAERERKTLEASARSQSASSPPNASKENDENASPDIVKPTPKLAPFVLSGMTLANSLRTPANRIFSEEALRNIMASSMNPQKQGNLFLAGPFDKKPLQLSSGVWKQPVTNRASLGERSQSQAAYQIRNPGQGPVRVMTRKSVPATIPIIRPKVATVSHSVCNILGVRSQNSANCN
uniref:E2F_TDP domain-containing protein n=1 Tax=Steinernema glaseri TaxID=37863 RepID=A0A1I7YUW3_9BILA